MDQSETIVQQLNKIIQTNIDREMGYQRAMEQVEDEQLREFMGKCRNVSAEYILALKPFVKQYGGIPAEDTSTAGDMYRAWMDIRTELTDNKDIATLKNCEKGEDVALNAYKEVTMNEEVPLEPHIVQVLHEQQSKIQLMHDHIKSLRDTRK